MDGVISEHAARVRALDPLVAAQGALPEAGELLEVPYGVATASVDRNDPTTMVAAWSPLVVHRLRARVAGPEPAAALGGLLDRWMAGIEPEPDSGLSVLWPSRDTAAVGALAARGFMPSVNIAARARGSAAEVGGFGIRPGKSADLDEVGGFGIRPGRSADLDEVARMYRALVAFDEQFGWVRSRPSTAARVRESLERLLAGESGWCWVADGLTGFVSVEPPDQASWIAPTVNVSPVAYLDCMYADPSARGRGLGAALAARAHAHLDAEGVEVTLLHHAVPNPLSTPFWARQGYRPVLTSWTRLLPVR